MATGKQRIGVALGSGSARGWAHIGVLQQLETMGIRPEIVCGCSIGSIVGAAYAVDNLTKLEQWALSLTRLEMMRYFELNTSFKGFIHQQRLRQFFHEHVCADQQSIEGLTKPFAAVATDLHSGREVWFTQGKVIDAVWASIAIPGLFKPFHHDGKWLVDGGLVNPVPVSLCRALGADLIIAVNLNGNVSRRISPPKDPKTAETPKLKDDTTLPENPSSSSNQSPSNRLVSSVTSSLRNYAETLFPDHKSTPTAPGIAETIMGSVYIMQDVITRSRMAGDPPEILLKPRVADVGLLEFYRAAEAIEEGKQCVIRMEAEITMAMEASQ